MALTGRNDVHCWCRDVTIDPALPDTLPATCVCRQCAAARGP
jgi:hypothetical protein